MKRARPWRRGQEMTEVAAVTLLVGLAIAWATMRLPQAISTHFQQNQKVLAAPL